MYVDSVSRVSVALSRYNTESSNKIISGARMSCGGQLHKGQMAVSAHLSVDRMLLSHVIPLVAAKCCGVRSCSFLN